MTASNDERLTDGELRTEVGKAFEGMRWIRAYLDDDSPEARAFDEVHNYAQGTDVEARIDEETSFPRAVVLPASATPVPSRPCRPRDVPSRRPGVE